MYEITVTRLSDGKKATAQASSPQILLDHLKASTSRNGFGFDIDTNIGGFLPEGDLFKGDEFVGYWFIKGV